MMKYTILAMITLATLGTLPARSAQTPEAWADAMQTTLAAMRRDAESRRFQPVSTDVRKGGMPPVSLTVDLAGSDMLHLAAIGTPRHNWGHAVWGEPVLTAHDGTTVKLTTLEPVSTSVGWGNLQIDKNSHGTPLVIDNSPIAFGFWAHADSKLVFKLDGRFKTLRTTVGIDARAGEKGHVVFTVSADDSTQHYESIAKRFPSFAALTRRFLDQPDTNRATLLEAAQAHQTKLRMDYFKEHIPHSTPDALVRSIRHILENKPDQFPQGPAHLKAALQFVQDWPTILQGLKQNDTAALVALEAFEALKHAALVRDNPFLDFDETLVVISDKFPTKSNWLGTHTLASKGYRNKIARLNIRTGQTTDIYMPTDGAYVGEFDLHYDAKKLLFTSTDSHNRWQVMEIGVDGTGLRQVSSIAGNNIHNYGGIYLPNEKIIFSSTAPLIGVPCISGSQLVPNLFLMDADGENVRQLTFDQDASWYPTVLPNGKIMYLRWEYTDIMHYYSRIMMTMNPDGSNQRSIYGSQSLWPNSMFNARPLPNSPGRFSAIVTGHHGVAATGKLTIFDTNKGHAHADGAVQHIPGYGLDVIHVIPEQLYPEVDEKLLEPFPDLRETVAGLVNQHMGNMDTSDRNYHNRMRRFYDRVYPALRSHYPNMALDLDYLVNGVWPQFHQPYPISDTHFLVLGKMVSSSPWRLYLADRFDNLVPLQYELEEGFQFVLEPYPLRQRTRPPQIPDRVDLAQNETTIFLQDIYAGPGLKDVPHGTVDSLRIFTYDYAYFRTGNHHHLGVESGWDVKRVLGTVKIEADGSAMFRAPANTTLSLQPIDAQGRAIQLFRSWLVGMPGENLGCIGCHEPPGEAPLGRPTIAAGKPPQRITPRRERVEGFSFNAEIQPVLDAYCISCHDGSNAAVPDFKTTDLQSNRFSVNFSTAYFNFHRYFRRPGPESTGLMLRPYEFHASTSEGVQLLEKGHYGVNLDDESWRRIFTWIDLNVPFHGSWADAYGQNRIADIAAQAAELRSRFASVDPDRDYSPSEPYPVTRSEQSGPTLRPAASISVANWPFDAETARQMQQQAGETTRRVIELGDGLSIAMVRIPAGAFIMGSDSETPMEQPRHVVQIEKPFWISESEIDNTLFFAFNPDHDPGYFNQQWKDHVVHGYSARSPRQPAVHVSWLQANQFSKWLGEKIGTEVLLPTEAQWEWACRAGSAEAFSFGAADADFSTYANLADTSLQQLAVTGVNPTFRPHLVGNPIYDFVPRDDRFDDGNFLVTGTKQYQPNAWGLYDMHGNVAEWTRSDYADYPYDEKNSNSLNGKTRKTVRGGSFFDRPYRATSSYRLGYEPWQGVFNVGFRIVIEE